MDYQLASDEYALALRKGQKEYRELLMAGRPAHPLVLDEILPELQTESVQLVGLVEIPAERLVGVKSAGRVKAFTASFRPLLGPKSEFGLKWISLCQAHLGPTGITDPIECFEYLGNFYVQEGNKRVSVLRHFDAPRIPGNVKRILPAQSDDPRIKAYYEFLDFYKVSQSYVLQFRRPGDYARFLSFFGKKSGEVWTEEERRRLSAGFHYFLEAFQTMNTQGVDILPEEALLQWLELYPFQDLSRLTATELKKTLSALWEDVRATCRSDSVQMATKAEDVTKPSIFSRITAAAHLNVAFVHQLDPQTSTWVLSHEEGREHIQRIFGNNITVRSYFNANSKEERKAVIAQAVKDGADVVFTTSPPLSRATLKAAVEHPGVRFLNCSVNLPYTSLRSYYGRMYEAKFITGAIAGAMSGDDRIGYITAYPIFGVPASINAFALGARMTNPRAQIELKWSCLPGSPQAELFADGVRVVSNRSTPTQSQGFLDFCSYGTYLMDDLGELIPLGSPVWVWGKFYEFVLRSIFAGGWQQEKGATSALNYWLGMDSGVIGLKLSEKLPEGVRQLARILEKGMCDGTIDPFARKIVAQDGTIKNDGTRTFTPSEILHMDWLCDNVVGTIPAYDELLPISQPLVRELGIYRDHIKPDKEVRPREDFDHIR